MQLPNDAPESHLTSHHHGAGSRPSETPIPGVKRGMAWLPRSEGLGQSSKPPTPDAGEAAKKAA
ncbi:hypothetical protein IMZ48_28990 [Candidatus Bathyarchaeota archaeon]|nr:hypothetical protein [Candidatus Bathyarchaeota archaeon]